MPTFRLPASVLALLVLAGVGPAGAGEDPPEAAPSRHDSIFPLRDIRPGLKGEVVTVLSATKTTRFPVEVIDVIHHYLAKEDVILVRCLGDDLARLGVAQGMSGSPMYIDGRVVGALSYTWAWSKEPLAGITPIETMLAEADRPLEGRASGAEPPTPLRQRPPVPIGADAKELVPIATPLAIGGFTAKGRAEIAAAMEPYGFDPHTVSGGLVAGAPGGWANLDAPLVPGSALVVDLIRGDLNVAAVGTCTWIEGDKILAFGHPFIGMGETLFPMSVGYVYTVVPSVEISFKLGASIRDVGALIQDRDAGIIGVRGKTAPMVPFDVDISNAVTGRKESFHVEITANRSFFQRMMFIALRDMMSRSEGTLGANSKRYTIQVKLAGVEKPWSYEDTIAGFDTGLSRILMGLVDRVMIHPTERAEFEWVKLSVEIENVDRRCTIEAASASRESVHPGDEVEVLARLRRRENGGIFYERVKLRIPTDAPAGGLPVLVTGGDMVPAEVANPVDVQDIPKLYAAFYKSTELIAVVPTGRVNLDMGGHLVRNVPLSALPRLARSNDSTGAQLEPVTEKVRRDVPYIVDGQATVVFDVER